MYYDRKGNPIGMDEWARSLEGNRIVAKTNLPNGKYVSTVWLGLDHSFGDGPPLIFETMVFRDKGPMVELDMQRYSTEAQAIAGHERMVGKWALIPGDSDDET